MRSTFRLIHGLKDTMLGMILQSPSYLRILYISPYGLLRVKCCTVRAAVPVAERLESKKTMTVTVVPTAHCCCHQPPSWTVYIFSGKRHISQGRSYTISTLVMGEQMSWYYLTRTQMRGKLLVSLSDQLYVLVSLPPFWQSSNLGVF